MKRINYQKFKELYQNMNTKLKAGLFIILVVILLLAILLSIMFTLPNKTNQVTITFNTLGGDELEPVIVDNVYQLPETTKIGHSFLGWYLDEGYSGQPIDTVDPKEMQSATLYAKWEIVAYSITYNLDSGINAVSNPSTYDVTQSVTLSPASKTGYGFMGWYDNENFTGSQINAIPVGSTGNITLYASFSLSTFNLFFDSMQGSSVATITQDYNTAVTKPANPTRANYTFDDWYTDDSFSAAYTFTVMPAVDTTLFAKWIPDTYVLTFDYQGATGGDATASKNIQYGLTYGTLPEPTKSLYDFDGWYTTSNTGGVLITAASIVQVTSNTTLYARWSESHTEGLLFSLIDGDTAYEVSKGTANTSQAIYIPSIYLGKPVTRIADDGFKSTLVPEILIPDTITEIGDSAFYNCPNLTDIDFVSLTSLIRIQQYAFKGCTSFVNVILPASLNNLQKEAFADCTNLEHVEFTSNVFSVNYNDMLKNCNKVQTLIISATDSYACRLDYIFGMSSAVPSTLEKVVAINGSSGIDSSFFNVGESNNIKEVELPVMSYPLESLSMSNLLKIETLTAPISDANNTNFKNYYNIEGIASIKTIYITQGTTAILSEALSYINAENINIPDSVTSIGDKAFEGTPNLISLTIPASVTTIGKGILCESMLTSITVDSGNTNFVVRDGVLYDIGLTRLIASPYLISDEHTIPNTVETIDEWAFYKSERLSVLLENESALVIIENNAFNSSKIVQIALPEMLTTIEDSAFAGSELTSIIIPESVSSIGNSVFQECALLESARFEKNSPLTQIGDTMFGWCESLTNVALPELLTSVPQQCFISCISLEEIALPSGIISIKQKAFYNCLALETFIAPEGVNNIGYNAIQGCAALTYVELPSTYTNAEEQFFLDCKSLEEIVLHYLPINSFVGKMFGATSNFDDYLSVTLSSVTYYVPNSLRKFTYKGIFGVDAHFTNLTMLEEIHITNVTSVRRSVFSGCAGLTQITAPLSSTPIVGSIDHLGHLFFDQPNPNSSVNSMITNLTKVNIIEGVTAIQNDAFKGLNKIVEVNLPSTITSIGDSAFESCTVLTGITIPSDVTTIGDSVFESCSALTSITIPAGVTTIGDSAFRFCHALATVTFEDNGQLTSIGKNAFRECVMLSSITIPDTVTTIGIDAFNHCDGLTNITFGENSQLTTLGDRAFYSCLELTSIAIPKTITTIGTSVLLECLSLTEITVPLIAPYADNTHSYISYFFGGVSWNGGSLPESLTTVNIATDTTAIANNAFRNKTKITTVIIPSSVTSIGEQAFGSCPALTTVTFSENSQLNSIGDNAFEACSELTGITIPSGVTTIGDYVFFSCSELTNMTIPSGVTTVGQTIFQACSSLEEITIPLKDGFSSVSHYIGGGLLTLNTVNIAQGTETIFSNAFNVYYVTTVTIPSSVTTIAAQAFYGNETLTTITFAENSNLYLIGDYAFKECGALESIIIPKQVTTIGEYAFDNCQSLATVSFEENSQLLTISLRAFRDCAALSSIAIPQGTTHIGQNAFECSSLESVYIPNSITTLGIGAFEGCTALSSVTFAYNSVLTTISYSAFKNCVSLATISIPVSVTTIGASAFEDCAELTTVDFFNSELVTIESMAFYNCVKLDNIMLSDCIETIGENAFANCESLNIFAIKNPTPPSLGFDVFYNTSAGLQIFVPMGSSGAYLADPDWNVYDINEAIF